MNNHTYHPIETQAEIEGENDHFIKVGSTLRLTCKVYLGDAGPDDLYAKTAVIHWFHDQRLLDPDLENWKTGRLEHDISSKVKENLNKVIIKAACLVNSTFLSLLLHFE